MFAHRGDAQYAENTQAAVLASMDSGYHGAEIDVQVLKDRETWVLHHDLLPGRVVEGLPDHALVNITASQWRSARIAASKRTGAETPTSLEELLQELASGVPRTWHLAIEIKWYWNSEAIRSLVDLTARYLPEGSYFFMSLDEKALLELRAAGYTGYLGWVVLHPAAITRSVSQKEHNYIATYGRHVGVTTTDVNRVLEGGRRLMEQTVLPDSLLSIGAPLGVHLEREMLVDQGLVLRLQQSDLHVFTYSALGNDIQHARYLGRRIPETGLTPTGTFVSIPPTEFCGELERVYAEDPEKRVPFAAAPLPTPPENRITVPEEAPLSPRPAPVDMRMQSLPQSP